MHSAWFVMQTSRSCAGSVRIGISLANQSENTWPNRTNELSSEARMFPNYTHGTRAYTISNKSEALGTSVRYGSDYNLRSRLPCPGTLVRVNRDLFRFFDCNRVNACKSVSILLLFSYCVFDPKGESEIREN